jgi:Fe-S-cluster containining protein
MAANYERLCTSCGLCCDGSMFADLELASAREALAAEAMGLEVDEADDARGGMVLVQPCAALKSRRCSVYAFRPKCCRSFECGLLQRVKRGLVSLEEAEGRVAAVILKIEEFKRVRGKQGREEVADLIQETFLTGGAM